MSIGARKIGSAAIHGRLFCGSAQDLARSKKAAMNRRTPKGF
jgi:hypothetical protein